jgi:hypothetical protein
MKRERREERNHQLGSPSRPLGTHLQVCRIRLQVTLSRRCSQHRNVPRGSYSRESSGVDEGVGDGAGACCVGKGDDAVWEESSE